MNKTTPSGVNWYRFITIFITFVDWGETKHILSLCLILFMFEEENINNVNFPGKIQSTVLIHYYYLPAESAVNKNK